MILKKNSTNDHPLPVHVKPFPVKPLLHEQLYDPIVFVQFALESQLLSPAHSLTSVSEKVKISHHSKHHITLFKSE